MIRIKAVETFVSFVKDKVTGTWRYIMRVENYSQLSADKVMDEASAHSGIARGAIKGAWDALGEVIKTWVTEGHSVAIPGLGSIRFAVNGKAVTNVNDVAKDLITTRKVVFTPSTEIKQVLKDTAISITCYDRNGNVVKRVQDESENETIDDGNGGTNGGNGGNDGNQGGDGGTDVTPSGVE